MLQRLGSQCTWLSAYLLLSPLLPARPEGQHLPSPVRAWPGPQVELREGSPVGFCATTNPLPQPVSLLALPPSSGTLASILLLLQIPTPKPHSPGMHPMPSLEPDDPSWEQPHPSMPSLAALRPTHKERHQVASLLQPGVGCEEAWLCLTHLAFCGQGQRQQQSPQTPHDGQCHVSTVRAQLCPRAHAILAPRWQVSNKSLCFLGPRFLKPKGSGRGLCPACGRR